MHDPQTVIGQMGPFAVLVPITELQFMASELRHGLAMKTNGNVIRQIEKLEALTSGNGKAGS